MENVSASAIADRNQKEAIRKLSRLKVGALFMEMGTGKTKVAMDLMASKAHKVNYLLWICPCSVKGEIEAERQKWHPELPIDIVGCESIGQSDRIYLETLEKVKSHKTFIVVDESLKIKNINAKRTQRILRMGQYAAYKLILNGTPLSKNVMDLYTQMEFLSPKILGMGYNEFKDNYCEYYTRGKMKGRIRRTHNVAHLVSKIEPYIFESALEISPHKLSGKYTYYVDAWEYGTAKNELFEKHYDTDRDELNFEAFAMGLQKFYTGSSEKMNRLNELLSEIDGQVIIFVKFLDNIPSGAHKITGRVKEDERQEIIDRFRNGEFKELWITYGCGAFGLNLQFCHNTIFADKIWDYSLVDQAEARTYRMGQLENVNYYNLTCANSGLERMIEDNIDRKGDLLHTVKEEIAKTKGGVKEWVKNI